MVIRESLLCDIRPPGLVNYGVSVELPPYVKMIFNDGLGITSGLPDVQVQMICAMNWVCGEFGV